MKFLLGKGANPNIRDNIGNTPLSGATNKKILQLLLEAGADPYAKAPSSDKTIYETYPLVKQTVDERNKKGMGTFGTEFIREVPGRENPRLPSEILAIIADYVKTPNLPPVPLQSEMQE